jgi:hypothetical protein
MNDGKATAAPGKFQIGFDFSFVNITQEDTG